MAVSTITFTFDPFISPCVDTNPDDVQEESELERTIGLSGAMTIGIGTMIGAGIFVFPGMAAGQSGPAATVAFGIGAVIALLVALPTSELATAMPKSGGGYYFISRAMGTLPGAIVGIGLMFGLIFATAFYLVGLGEYAGAVLTEAGIPGAEAISVGPLSIVLIIGIVVGIALTIASMTGTQNTEAIQNIVVGLLLAILAVFLSFSGANAIGVIGASRLPVEFAPEGYAPILATAALVFTSYLGFAQIATVGEDIVDPGQNLPLAMIGSVVIVAILYAVTVYLAAITFETTELLEMGETAIVEVAREYLGGYGAIAILIAGLLATLSSANASILSASRSVYALSTDEILPEVAARINLKYGTPHFALSFVGGVTVILVAVGRTEMLAEVASFLHLVMYGLMCVALIMIRRNPPEWYDPAFTCPGYPWVPIIGAISSFGLIGFMQRDSQILGSIIVVIAIGWYFYYARDVTLRGDPT